MKKLPDLCARWRRNERNATAKADPARGSLVKGTTCILRFVKRSASCNAMRTV